MAKIGSLTRFKYLCAFRCTIVFLSTHGDFVYALKNALMWFQSRWKTLGATFEKDA